MLVGDLECAFVELERSPHTYFVPALFFKEKKWNNKASTGLNTGELKTYFIIIIKLLLSIYYVYFYLFTNLFILKQGYGKIALYL